VAGLLATAISLGSALPVLAESATLTVTPPGGDKNIYVGVESVINITNTGLTTPITFTTVDTHPGTTFSSSNIDSSGVAKWKPSYDELGYHTITVTASDANGASAVATFPIIVNLPKTTIIAGKITPSETVPSGTSVSFDVTTTGFTYSTYSLTDSFGGSSITNTNISTTGNFSWTPGSAETGTHTITVTARDFRGSVATTIVTINVVAAGTYVAPAVTQVTTPVIAPYVAPTPTVLGSTVFTLFLTLNSKGPEVTALQNVLTAGGYYSGEITGFFGPMTQSALKKYQLAKGIDPQGFVGPSTRAVLNGSSVAGVTTTSVSVINPVSTMSATDRASRIASLRTVIQYLQIELDRLVAGQ
jgi:hypothetical protein